MAAKSAKRGGTQRARALPEATHFVTLPPGARHLYIYSRHLFELAPIGYSSRLDTRPLRPTILIAALLLALTSATTAPASAQMHLGPQASLGTDSGAGLGARLLFPLRAGILGVEGGIDGNYFFGGGRDVDSWVDVNVNVRIPVPLARDFRTRIGAGLNATFISLYQTGTPTTSTESDVGVNLLGSIELPERRLSPFAELRVVVGGSEQVVLTGGFTVGPAR